MEALYLSLFVSERVCARSSSRSDGQYVTVEQTDRPGTPPLAPREEKPAADKQLMLQPALLLCPMTTTFTPLQRHFHTDKHFPLLTASGHNTMANKPLLLS